MAQRSGPGPAALGAAPVVDGQGRAIAAVIVLRYLPHTLTPEGALSGPVEAMENVAELGLAGVPPAFGERGRARVELRSPNADEPDPVVQHRE